MIFQGHIISELGNLALVQNDPNGSGETGLRLAAASPQGIPLPEFTGKVNGAAIYAEQLDLAGTADTGSPTAQHEDRLVRDGTSNRWKPARRLGLSFGDLMPLGLVVSDPPTQGEVQAVANRLDELLTRLQGM